MEFNKKTVDYVTSSDLEHDCQWAREKVTE